MYADDFTHPATLEENADIQPGRESEEEDIIINTQDVDEHGCTFLHYLSRLGDFTIDDSVSTQTKPLYLKGQILQIEDKIKVLYHINSRAREHINPRIAAEITQRAPFNRLWLSTLQARSGSILYSVEELINSTAGQTQETQTRNQSEMEQICNYLRSHIEQLRHEVQQVEGRICTE